MLILQTAKYLGTNVTCCDANGVWVSLTSYTNKNQLNQSLHAHENPHVTLLLEGGTSEKRKGMNCDRLAGDVIFFQSGEPHENSRTLLPSKNINLEFEPFFSQRFGVTEEEIGNAIKKTPDAKFVLLKAYKELLQKDNFTKDSISMLLLHFVKNVAPRKLYTPHSWIGTIHELLQDRWNEHITLDELAATVGVHPVTISKHFPSFFSCTLGEYMRKLRIERALRLIKSGRYSLSEIAHRCGFSDQSHFIRIFKQLTGLLPGEYRKL